MCSYVLLPCSCSTSGGCPLHGIYFSLRTTCTNTSIGNHKWEEESATGRRRDLERVYWREVKGEEGTERMSASWELFLISRAESHALSPENMESGPFLVCSPSLALNTHLFLFLSFSPLHILYSQHLCSVCPLLFLLSHLFFFCLIDPFNTGHSLASLLIFLACPYTDHLVPHLICWIIPKHPLSLSSPLSPLLPSLFSFSIH